MYGHMPGRRNNPWLNRSAPGLAIALSGSNADVKINDLLPITAITHENEICEQRCISKDSTKRQRVLRWLAQRVTRIQSQRNGYFGGYICKRQKIRKLEMRKCRLASHQNCCIRRRRTRAKQAAERSLQRGSDHRTCVAKLIARHKATKIAVSMTVDLDMALQIYD